jgi:SAM-dependent methyltransferase
MSREPWFADEAGFFGPSYLMETGQELSPERTLREADFIEKILSLKPGCKLLDMPCGYGRHAIELERRGYKVTGVDLSVFFLKTAETNATAAGASPRFERQDMRFVSFENEFDFALNLFTALGYFDSDDDDQRIFNGFARSLKPGGEFLVDFVNRELALRNFTPKGWRKLPDGAYLLIEREYDMLTGRCVDRRTIIRGGIQTVSKYVVRFYTTVELIKLGTAAGLRLKGAYGDFDGSELSMDSKRSMLIFEKP